MATEYVLIRDDIKEMFNLGKNPRGFTWWDIPKFYDAIWEERKNPLEWKWKDNIAKFKFTHLELLKDYLIEDLPETDKDLIPYYKNLLDKLSTWADHNEVYIGHDEMEHDLLKQDYKVTNSRYS